MQPPLPEVPKHITQSTAKPALLGLNIVACVESVSILIGCILYLIFPQPTPSVPTVVLQIACGVIGLLYALVVFYLWRGYNWARWVMIFFSVLSLVTFFDNDTGSRLVEFERIYEIVGNVWAVGLGIWLLLPGVARHFKAPASPLGTNS